MNNNSYGRNYMPTYNQQSIYEQNIVDQIDGQINQLVGMKNQIRNNNMNHANQQPTAINQTFQLAPNNNGGMRYVNSIEDVKKETVFVDTPFFSKDFGVLWLKNASGEIKAYELNEIVEKDEKDLQIEFLSAKISELEGMIKNEQSYTNVIKPESTTSATKDDEPTREPIKESKSSSIQKISRSKEK